MPRPAKFAVPVAAACALTALTALPASAATTTVRKDTATGAPYSGNWRITTVGPLNFSTVILGQQVTAVCDDAQLTGTVTSTGAGELTGASVGECTTSGGISAGGITFGELPEIQGQVTYAPVPGGRDGTLDFAEGITIKLEGVFLGVKRTCYYGLRGRDGGGLAFDIFNRDNPNRPLPGLDDAQGTMVDATAYKLPGSALICPNTGTGSGRGIARGETVPGSGVFDQKLYVTS
ncbi:MAG TPA: hypothetical protein VHJ17_12510 [Thermomonospora sp.]|nr:hypothetical protein [Thermomonospora sp.]